MRRSRPSVPYNVFAPAGPSFHSRSITARSSSPRVGMAFEFGTEVNDMNHNTECQSVFHPPCVLGRHSFHSFVRRASDRLGGDIWKRRHAARVDFAEHPGVLAGRFL